MIYGSERPAVEHLFRAESNDPAPAVPTLDGCLRMHTNSALQHVNCLGNGGIDASSVCPGDDLDESDADSAPSSPIDLDRIRRAIREILIAVGEDPAREGLRETPDRVARMYAEVFQGLNQDPKVHLKKLFTQKYDEMVLIRDIRFVSFCEHHLLPVIGKAHVAYIPNGKVIGLSKIPRVVDVLAQASPDAGTADGGAGRPADERARRQGRGRGDRGQP